MRIEEKEERTEGEEVRNGMGGQTWVNLASGGHALPEETGASRLASTLMAFTYSHTCAYMLQASPRELQYHRDVELVRTQL